MSIGPLQTFAGNFRVDALRCASGQNARSSKSRPMAHAGVPETIPPTVPFRSVPLDALRAGKHAVKVAEDVISHLAALPNAKLKVTLEIHAEVPEGIDEHTVRTVTTNADALKFDKYGFEEE